MDLTRRELLAGGLAALPVLPALASGSGRQDTEVRPMGVVAYCYGLRLAADRAGGPNAGLNDPIAFVEHCQQRGAGGVQMSIGVRDSAYAARLRDKIADLHMYLEGIIRLPKDRMDAERFAREVTTAKEAGAKVLRTVLLGTRRYETFETAAAFRDWTDRAWHSLVSAEPIIAGHDMRLAIENHKDLRTEELLPLLKRLSSQHVGLCVDLANSIALLEDPVAVVEAYAPWAFSTHMKDVAVLEYEDGFLLGEVPLGEGLLDLKKITAILRQARPEIHLNLEMITRDPLKVPCLTPRYWATFEKLPGRHLARTMSWVRKHQPSQRPAPVNGLTQEQKLAVEESNVQKSLAYARKHLS
ncbi:MAG TPA: sugar phosphate isomerase/epimerase [Gemmataceae bacterium]|nr:sugar phosphate isomerase/epimerase [Gemmataceae bacterium]